MWSYASAGLFLLPRGREHYSVMDAWECDHRIRKRGKEHNQTHLHSRNIFILKDSWFTTPVQLLPRPHCLSFHFQNDLSHISRFSVYGAREHRKACCELTLAGISTDLFPEPCPALSVLILTSKSHLLQYHYTEDWSSHIPGWRGPNQTKYRF